MKPYFFGEYQHFKLDVFCIFLYNMTIDNIREALCERFTSIDYPDAKQDVLQFIKNPASVDSWSADFFTKIAQNITAVQ